LTSTGFASNNAARRQNQNRTVIQTHLVPRDQVDSWLAERRDEGLDIAMSLYGSLWLAKSVVGGR